MLIDWFTVGAQLLNFFILVWLMKRFLYQPILTAIDAREKSIADKLAAADAISNQANAAKAEFAQKNQEFAQQRGALMQQATAAADTERQHLLDAARQDAIKLANKHQLALKKQQHALAQSISQQVQQEVFAITTQVLRDLASAELEAQIVAIFIQRLRSMNPSQVQTLKAALGKPTEPISVRSNYPLTAAAKQLITTELASLLNDNALNKSSALQFSTSTQVICGIELDIPGFKVGWSVAEYLTALQSTLASAT